MPENTRKQFDSICMQLNTLHMLSRVRQKCLELNISTFLSLSHCPLCRLSYLAIFLIHSDEVRNDRVKESLLSKSHQCLDRVEQLKQFLAKKNPHNPTPAKEMK